MNIPRYLREEAPDDETLEAWASRLEKGESPARILGKREFWSMDFHLNHATLEPRPDSETVIEAVLKNFPDKNAPLTVLDLGTGSGCLLVAALFEYPNAKGLGIDINPDAIAMTVKNAEINGVNNRCRFETGCWGRDVNETFDVILCNPPYITHDDIETLAPTVKDYDPHLALDGGEDGLSCYRALMPDIKRLLKKGGLAFLEMGMGQIPPITLNLKIIGWEKDLAGIDRVAVIAHA